MKRILATAASLWLLSGCAYQAGHFDDIQQAKDTKKSAESSQTPVTSSISAQGPANVAPEPSPSGTAASQAARMISPLTN